MTRRYVVGSALIALAAVVMGKIDIRTAALPVMERFGAMTHETISLHIRNQRHRTCIQVVPGTHPVSRVIQVGQTLPLYAGASGKVLLAHVEPAENASILDWARIEGVDIDQLCSDIETIRRDGALAIIGRGGVDHTLGIGALSVPVFDAAGVVACMTISGPGERWNVSAMSTVMPLLISACAELSASLGGRPVVGTQALRDADSKRRDA